MSRPADQEELGILAAAGQEAQTIGVVNHGVAVAVDEQQGGLQIGQVVHRAQISHPGPNLTLGQPDHRPAQGAGQAGAAEAAEGYHPALDVLLQAGETRQAHHRPQPGQPRGGPDRQGRPHRVTDYPDSPGVYLGTGLQKGLRCPHVLEFVYAQAGQVARALPVVTKVKHEQPQARLDQSRSGPQPTGPVLAQPM